LIPSLRKLLTNVTIVESDELLECQEPCFYQGHYFRDDPLVEYVIINSTAAPLSDFAERCNIAAKGSQLEEEISHHRKLSPQLKLHAHVLTHFF
jgi:hypothetical protein